MDNQNIATVDTMSRHTFAEVWPVSLRRALYRAMMPTVDSGWPMGTMVHVAECPMSIPMTSWTDTLATINVAVVTVAVAALWYFVDGNDDVLDGFAVFAIWLMFLVCDADDICSRDVLSCAALCVECIPLSDWDKDRKRRKKDKTKWNGNMFLI